jgi:hypothetical protein
MRVEFLRVFAEHTWDVETFTVPDFLTSPSSPNHQVLEEWAARHLPGDNNIACYYVYSIPPDEENNEYSLLGVDKGDECPLCECGTVGHEADMRGQMFAKCRGECGESAELPPYICPICRMQFGAVIGNAPIRKSIEDNGQCLNCQETFTKKRSYKVWMGVEEICEELDHYVDVDIKAPAIGIFGRQLPAVRFAELLQECGTSVYDQLPPGLTGQQNKEREQALACWGLVSSMLETPTLRASLSKHFPDFVAEALRIFEEKEKDNG